MIARGHRPVRRTARAGVTAVLTAVLTAVVTLTGCEAHDIPLPGHPAAADESFEVTVTFRDVLNLAPRSVVMVNDVPVGEVIALEPDGWRAEAVLRIREDVELPANAVAEIRQSSILGEKYVALEPPWEAAPAGRLGPDDHIPLARSGRNPELEEVLSSVGFLLNGGGVAQLETITSEVNTALEGREQQVRDVLGNLTRLVSTLDDQKSQVIGAMESVNDLSSTLNEQDDTISRALDAFGPAIDAVAGQHDQLIALLDSLDGLSTTGTRVVRKVADDLIADLESLQPTLRELNRVGDHLPAAVGMLASFPWTYDADRVERGDFGNVAAIASIDLDQIVEIAGITDIPILRQIITALGDQVSGLGTLLGLPPPGGGGDR